MFPIYLTSDCISVISYDPYKLSAIETKTTNLLEQFHVMWVHDLFKYEGELNKLGGFVGIVSFMPLICFHFIQHLT